MRKNIMDFFNMKKITIYFNMKKNTIAFNINTIEFNMKKILLISIWTS